MANKDLIKRAFSVTANLPPVAAGSSAAASPLPAVGEEVQAEDMPTTAAEVPIQHTARTAMPGPKTSPGSMLAFMTEQSEVHREVVRLRAQVKEFDGADTARRLDPTAIAVSKWANRDESHFATAAFTRLKQEIESAGGNIQPIKVRSLEPPLSAQSGKQWEVVYGHRRHRACLELGIPVLALIQRDMKDADLFVEMERENREREDLSAWEQGVMYMRALEMGLFPSAKQLAAAIDRDMGNISRAMALAKLPADVVSAFGSPLNLQFRWASPLKEAHQRDPDGLLNTARELASSEPRLPPAKVFAMLTAAGSVTRGTQCSPVEWKSEQGVRLAALTSDRKGRVAIQFDQLMDANQQRKLVKLLSAFLGQQPDAEV